MDRSAVRHFDNTALQQGSSQRTGPRMVPGTAQGTVLLVKDNASTARRLVTGLRRRGFETLHAADGGQGLLWARTLRPDLVLLDADPSTSPGQGLPQTDSFAVCRTLRQESVVPIIMLSARGREIDRIRGLEIGADDYIVEPYSLRELVARMRALLRRRELDRQEIPLPSDQIVVRDIVLDHTTQQVWRAGRLIEMPQREFNLLHVLMENAGQAVPRRALVDQVWGEGWVGCDDTLKVHIYRLRQKLEDDPSAPHYIQTVHRYGYRFVAPAASPATERLQRLEKRRRVTP
ncbi:MAG: response regulator transcription factor [Anaerolineae bacterium]